MSDTNTDFEVVDRPSDLESSSCKSKKKSSTGICDAFLKSFQKHKGLKDMTLATLPLKGGVGSRATKTKSLEWWNSFWATLVVFMINSQKKSGEAYGGDTLVRYFGVVKTKLEARFGQNDFWIKEILPIYLLSLEKLKTHAKQRDKASPTKKVVKKKLFCQENLNFLLIRCLWANDFLHLQLMLFQVALIRLSSRATETAVLSITNLSVRDIYDGDVFHILQVYLSRDKHGDNEYCPILHNYVGHLDDVVLAIALVLFMAPAGTTRLMPAFAAKAIDKVQDSVVPGMYKTMLKHLFKRFPSTDGRQTGLDSNSHFGKHSAQALLNSACLDRAAALFVGHTAPVKGNRLAYFDSQENKFPYLLEGAKCLGKWPRFFGQYPNVTVPTLSDMGPVLGEIGDKLLQAFFGHLKMSKQVGQFLLVVLVGRVDHVLASLAACPTPDEQPLIGRSIIYKRLKNVLAGSGVTTKDYGIFKQACMVALSKYKYSNHVKTTKEPQCVPPVAMSVPHVTALFGDVTLRSDHISDLLSMVKHGMEATAFLYLFFQRSFMTAVGYEQLTNLQRQQLRKLKRAVKVMVLFLPEYPRTSEIPEAHLNIVKRDLRQCLQMHAVYVPKTLSLTKVRDNANLFLGSGCVIVRKFPPNTPEDFKFYMNI